MLKLGPRPRPRPLVLGVVLAALAIALPLALRGTAPTPSLAQQPTASPTASPTGSPAAGFTACPPAGGWVNAVWMGANNTPAGQALATCSGADLAFAFDPTAGWTWFIPGAPGNTLPEVDNTQAVWLHRAA